MEAIFDWIESTAMAIGDIYKSARGVRSLILDLLTMWVSYYLVYRVLGFFCTRKFKPTQNKHKYAICIAARNEETVIGNLIASIKNQDYPSDLLTIFVIADNCTDKTAQVARDMGAICYERFDDVHKTKGFALQFLFNKIEKDYGIENFEGYFVFDADNLLNKDYVTRMNEAFDAGEKIVTSYRNTKNFDENWIAATYAIHWLRSARNSHRARSVLRIATNIQGTGFLFANEFVRNGWNYTSLTEDRAFTADAVAQGYPISYCDAAIFYDEQPTSLKVALRQRLRWSKGHLMAFTETGPRLFKNIFVGPRYLKENKQPKQNVHYHYKPRPNSIWKRFLEQIRFRWASFDTLTQLFPSVIVKIVLWLAISVFIYSCHNYFSGIHYSVDFGDNIIGNFLTDTFGKQRIDVDAGVKSIFVSIGLMLMWNTIGRLSHFIKEMITPLYIFIVENRRIIKIPLYKKLFYVIMWPTFNAIGRWTTYIALFKKVEWKPIPHTSTVTIEQIEIATEEKNSSETPAYTTNDA